MNSCENLINYFVTTVYHVRRKLKWGWYFQVRRRRCICMCLKMQFTKLHEDSKLLVLFWWQQTLSYDLYLKMTWWWYLKIQGDSLGARFDKPILFLLFPARRVPRGRVARGPHCGDGASGRRARARLPAPHAHRAQTKHLKNTIINISYSYSNK